MEHYYRLVHADGTRDEDVERMTEEVAMKSNRVNASENNPWRWEMEHETGCSQDGPAVECDYCNPSYRF